MDTLSLLSFQQKKNRKKLYQVLFSHNIKKFNYFPLSIDLTSHKNAAMMSCWSIKNPFISCNSKKFWGKLFKPLENCVPPKSDSSLQIDNCEFATFLLPAFVLLAMAKETFVVSKKYIFQLSDFEVEIQHRKFISKSFIANDKAEKFPEKPNATHFLWLKDISKTSSLWNEIIFNKSFGEQHCPEEKRFKRPRARGGQQNKHYD